MVQITVDTNTDTIPELEEALHIIQTALTRRKGTQTVAAPVMHAPPAQVEDSAEIDTPFLKITVKDVPETPSGQAASTPKMPTLNQLLTDDSLSEEEITTLFKETQRLEQEERKDHPAREPSHKQETADAFIEIVEFDDEKEE